MTARRPALLVLPLVVLLAVPAGALAAAVPPRAGPPPVEHEAVLASSFLGDVRALPEVAAPERTFPERHAPAVLPAPLPGTSPLAPGAAAPVPAIAAPAPTPLVSFAGLDRTRGAGFPPDPNGDVGPNHYVQAINSAVGIYRKTDGFRLATFTFNSLMAQGAFTNPCANSNFGDPVVLYDTFADRWILTDFAFTLDAQSNVLSPPGAFQCFAVSRTGDPVAGGWNFYSIETVGGLGDYPKLGVWPDAIYLSVNMFGYTAAGVYQNPRVFAFDKAAMYAGAATVRSVRFDAPGTEFTVLPANARLQSGAPPAGRANPFAVVWNLVNAVSVYWFHVDWTNTAASTFTGPFNAVAPSSWTYNEPPTTVPSPGNALDPLPVRLMMQNQYTNLSGAESIWDVHTVRGSGVQTAVRYYQVNVTGGAVAATTVQAATHNPDTTTNRFNPSLAVDSAGNLAIGYSASSATLNPSIRYAGRLATDPPNTLGQTEISLVEGTGSQVGSCGGATCDRWGDYSAMTLDPDGCTFWYTNEYYGANGLTWLTRIGSFRFASCGATTPTSLAAAAASGVFGGTVGLQATLTSSGIPVAGRSVAFALGGTQVGTATTGATGLATLAAAPLGSTGAGAYAAGVTATFSGDATFSPSVASAALTVARAQQAITFAALPDHVATDPAFAVSATGGGSTSPVTFSTASTACRVAGATVTLLAAGACAVRADQAGDANFDAAAPVTRTFNVALASQTLAFPAIAPFTWKGGTAALAASATSGLAPSYSVLAGPCSAAGATLSATGAGTCQVAADQAGDARYAAAPRVTVQASVARAAPDPIAFGALADRLATAPAATLSATGGGATAPVTFSTASAACAVTGTTLSVLRAGACAVLADQAGDANYLAAATVTQSFTVALAPQGIAFPAIAPFSRDGATTLAATTDSGLAVTYGVLSGPCAVTGTRLTATAAGTCTIAADQAGDDRFAAAVRVTSTVTVTEPPAPRAASSGCGCASGDAPSRSLELALAALAGLALRPRRPRPSVDRPKGRGAEGAT